MMGWDTETGDKHSLRLEELTTACAAAGKRLIADRFSSAYG